MPENPNQHYYDYLEGVRDSGGINMFAAPSLLREAYDLSRSEAQSIALEWMRSYKNPKEQCEPTT